MKPKSLSEAAFEYGKNAINEDLFKICKNVLHCLI